MTGLPLVGSCRAESYRAACMHAMLGSDCQHLVASHCKPFATATGVRVLACGQLDVCTAYEDLTAENFKSWVAHTSANLSPMACVKTSDESGECRRFCCTAAVDRWQTYMTHLLPSQPPDSPWKWPDPVFHLAALQAVHQGGVH